MGSSQKSQTQQHADRRGCFFCGRQPLSWEHILPNWLHEAIPEWNQSWLVKTVPDGTGTRKAVQKSFDRSMLNDQVKEVCEVCNNGWMSQLEEKFKVTLMRLIAGHPAVLSTEEIKRLRRWAIKTHMIRSLKDRRDADVHDVYSQESRNAIRDGSSSPAGWDVWLGPAGVNGVMHRHWGIALLDEDDMPVVLHSQSTLEIGGLILIVTYIAPSDMRAAFVADFNDILADNRLSIHELQDSQPFLVWPVGQIVTHEAAIFISDMSRQMHSTDDMPELFDHSELIGDLPSLPAG